MRKRSVYQTSRIFRKKKSRKKKKSFFLCSALNDVVLRQKQDKEQLNWDDEGWTVASVLFASSIFICCTPMSTSSMSIGISVGCLLSVWLLFSEKSKCYVDDILGVSINSFISGLSCTCYTNASRAVIASTTLLPVTERTILLTLSACPCPK